MFKKFAALLVLFVAAAPAFLGAVSNDPQKPSIWSVGNPDPNSGSTNTLTGDFDGNLLPGKNVAQDIGESTHSFRIAYVGRIISTGGLYGEMINYGLIESSNAVGFGQFLVSTTTLGGGGTTYASQDIVAMSTTPRNLVIQSSFTVGMTTSVASGIAIVTGIDAKGSNRTETISFSTAISEGLVAWAQVSSVTLQTSSTSLVGEQNVTLRIGYANKIGLNNPVVDTSDIYKVTTTTGSMPLSQQTIGVPEATITFSVAPNGTREFHVWHRVKRSLH